MVSESGTQLNLNSSLQLRGYPERALDNRSQIDLKILDFSKAFDTVPHKQLLKKINYYGIRSKTHKWIETWLTTRNQRVVIDGEASDNVHVEYGVPQVKVLGPLLFYSYSTTEKSV